MKSFELNESLLDIQYFKKRDKFQSKIMITLMNKNSSSSITTGSAVSLHRPEPNLPKIVEGYFKKHKNEDASNVKRLLLAAAAAVSSNAKAKYTKRWFVLNTEQYTLSYAKEKGKKPTTTILARDIVSIQNINPITTQYKLQNNIDPFEKQHPDGYEHGVDLITRERSYRLFSKDYNLKELFLYTLQELLKRRGTFQNSLMQYGAICYQQQRSESVHCTTPLRERQGNFFELDKQHSYNTPGQRPHNAANGQSSGMEAYQNATQNGHNYSSIMQQKRLNSQPPVPSTIIHQSREAELYHQQTKNTKKDHSIQGPPMPKSKGNNNMQQVDKKNHGSQQNSKPTNTLNQQEEIDEDNRHKNKTDSHQQAQPLMDIDEDIYGIKQPISNRLIKQRKSSEQIQKTTKGQQIKDNSQVQRASSTIVRCLNGPHDASMISALEESLPKVEIEQDKDTSVLTLDLKNLSADKSETGSSKIRIDTNALKELSNIQADQSYHQSEQSCNDKQHNQSNDQSKQILIQINININQNQQININNNNQGRTSSQSQNQQTPHDPYNNADSPTKQAMNDPTSSPIRKTQVQEPGVQSQTSLFKRRRQTSQTDLHEQIKNKQANLKNMQDFIVAAPIAKTTAVCDIESGSELSSPFYIKGQGVVEDKFAFEMQNLQASSSSLVKKRRKRRISSNNVKYAGASSDPNLLNESESLPTKAKTRTTKRKKRIGSIASSQERSDLQDYETTKVMILGQQTGVFQDQLESMRSNSKVENNTNTLMITKQRSDENQPTSSVIQASLQKRQRDQSLKERIQNVIDDRGSDLSSSEELEFSSQKMNQSKTEKKRNQLSQQPALSSDQLLHFSNQTQNFSKPSQQTNYQCVSNNNDKYVFGGSMALPLKKSESNKDSSAAQFVMNYDSKVSDIIPSGINNFNSNNIYKSPQPSGLRYKRGSFLNPNASQASYSNIFSGNNVFVNHAETANYQSYTQFATAIGGSSIHQQVRNHQHATESSINSSSKSIEGNLTLKKNTLKNDLHDIQEKEGNDVTRKETCENTEVNEQQKSISPGQKHRSKIMLKNYESGAPKFRSMNACTTTSSQVELVPSELTVISQQESQIQIASSKQQVLQPSQKQVLTLPKGANGFGCKNSVARVIPKISSMSRNGSVSQANSTILKSIQNSARRILLQESKNSSPPAKEDFQLQRQDEEMLYKASVNRIQSSEIKSELLEFGDNHSQTDKNSQDVQSNMSVKVGLNIPRSGLITPVGMPKIRMFQQNSDVSSNNGGGGGNIIERIKKAHQFRHKTNETPLSGSISQLALEKVNSTSTNGLQSCGDESSSRIGGTANIDIERLRYTGGYNSSLAKASPGMMNHHSSSKNCKTILKQSQIIRKNLANTSTHADMKREHLKIKMNEGESATTLNKSTFKNLVALQRNAIDVQQSQEQLHETTFDYNWDDDQIMSQRQSSGVTAQKAIMKTHIQSQAQIQQYQQNLSSPRDIIALRRKREQLKTNNDQEEQESDNSHNDRVEEEEAEGITNRSIWE